MATGGRPGPCLTPDWKPTAAGIKLQVTVRKKKKRRQDVRYYVSRISTLPRRGVRVSWKMMMYFASWVP